MKSLKSRLKARQNGEDEFISNVTQAADREAKYRGQIETQVREYFKGLKLTSMSFPGPSGAGIAPGGDTAQVLTKHSPADFDTVWQTPAAVTVPPVIIGNSGSVVVSAPTFAAWQAAVTYSQANGYIDVIVPGGNYVAASNADQILLAGVYSSATNEILIPKCKASGHVVVNCSAYTSTQAAILVTGQSGPSTISYLQGFTFLGNISFAIGVENQGVCFYEVRDCQFYSLLESTRATGRGDVTMFPEGFVLRGGVTRSTVLTIMRYHVVPASGSSQVSFHGTGPYQHAWEMNGLAAGLIIERNCKPYNAPLDIRFQSNAASLSTLNGTVLIQQFNGVGDPAATFTGNMRFEAFQATTPKIVAALSAGTSAGRVYYEGPIIGIGWNRGNTFLSSNPAVAGFRLGIMTVGPYINLNNIGENQNQNDNAIQLDMLPGDNNTGINAQGSTRFNVHLSASNYDVHWTGVGHVDINGGAGYFSVSQTANYFDAAGYGNPSFSINTVGTLIITGNSFPITGVTAFINSHKDADPAFTNIVNGIGRIEFKYAPAQNFDNTAVDLTANTITLTTTKGFFQASPVVYREAAATGGTVGSITGLVDGTTYYVIIADTSTFTTIQLASTPANAIAGVAIDLTAKADGTGTWTHSIVG